MPGTLIPDSAKLLILGDISTARLAGADAHLFTNSPTLSHATVLGDLTEAAWTGYAPQGLTGWTSPSINGSFHAETTADPVQFANASGSSQTATGYYYTDSGGDLIGVQLYPAPIVIPDGLFLQETITHTYTSEF